MPELREVSEADNTDYPVLMGLNLITASLVLTGSLFADIGYALVDMLHDWLPYFLVVASSSFVYVALADLIPQLQKRLSLRETLAQIAWLLVGIALVVVVSTVAHHD